MGNGIGRRVDELEAVFGTADDADSTIVERDDDGRIIVIALRFSYHFDETGAVVGIKVGKQIHARRLDEPLWEFRRRVISPDGNVWREVLEQMLPSRGLPRVDYDLEAREQCQRAVAADAVRRKGEGEWGERIIGLVELFEADDLGVADAR